MRYLVLVLALIVGTPAVATMLLACTTGNMPGPTLEEVRVMNRQNLMRLSVGMTKDEVLAIMGTGTIETYRKQIREMDTDEVYRDETITQPYRNELIETSAGEPVELLWYYTDRKKADGVLSDDELTPLILQEGHLVGWGWSFLSQNVERYNITIQSR